MGARRYEKRNPGIVGAPRAAHTTLTMRWRGRWCWALIALVAGALGMAGGCAGGQTGHATSAPGCEPEELELSFAEAAMQGYDAEGLLPQLELTTAWREEELVLLVPAAVWTSRDLPVPEDRHVNVTLRERLSGRVLLRTGVTCQTDVVLLLDVEVEIPEVDVTLSGRGRGPRIVSWNEAEGEEIIDEESLTLDELGTCTVREERTAMVCQRS